MPSTLLLAQPDLTLCINDTCKASALLLHLPPHAHARKDLTGQFDNGVHRDLRPTCDWTVWHQSLIRLTLKDN